MCSQIGACKDERKAERKVVRKVARKAVCRGAQRDVRSGVCGVPIAPCAGRWQRADAGGGGAQAHASACTCWAHAWRLKCFAQG
eukprot:5608617-Pleurochrysis_carterae.AAC.1